MRSRIIPAHAGFTSPPPPGPCSRRDHPRTRGVYAWLVQSQLVAVGSSPHTRGLQDGAGATVLGGRIIPAHAGFTRTRQGSDRGGKDHPRTRGVYSNREPADYGWGGSSPHTRGLLRGRGGGLQYRRIIPAHAGFTRKRKLVDREGADHPRTRGVYEDIWIPVVKAIGSSPHTRGLPRADPSPVARLRIIPAHAGFTSISRLRARRRRDHPRTRGVYTWAAMRSVAAVGSSPHTRGLRPASSVMVMVARIIPAHAGFTPSLTPSSRPTPDHPRTRGVYLPPIPGRFPRAGSSPHTRGLRVSIEIRIPAHRIIPAHAGFTTAALRPMLGLSDHPRTRGVYSGILTCQNPSFGSSPHTRGLHAIPVEDILR